MKKRTLAALLITSMTLSLGVSLPNFTSYAETDVTSSMKKNSTVNYFAEQVNYFVDMEAAAKEVDGTKNVKMTDSKKVDIVCAALMGNDSKNDIDHDDYIKDGEYFRVKDASIQKTYKKMYNKSVRLSDIKMTKKDVTVKENDKFYYKGGDWGEGKPVYTITSISKGSSGTLTVYMTNDFKNTETGIKYFTQGTTTMKLKKTSSGKYYLKKVRYTVTNKSSGYDKNIDNYASVLKNLKDGQSYAFVDMSDSIDALLVTDYTYRYDNKTQAAISATVYGINSRGQVVEAGKVESAGTAYPLSCGDTNHCLYYGSGHSVDKATLRNNTTLATVESATENFDQTGTATYYYNGNRVPNDSHLKRLFQEWLNNSIVINFTKI